MSPHDEPHYPDGIRPTLFQEGLEFQDFVCVTLAQKNGWIIQNYGSKRFQIERGENVQGFEIKLDRRCHDTGRLSIEIAEKSRAANCAWVNSGIYRSDNTLFYIQGNEQEFFIFPKKYLIHYFEKYNPPIDKSHPTVRKFYIPLSSARALAAQVYVNGTPLPIERATPLIVAPPPVIDRPIRTKLKTNPAQLSFFKTQEKTK